MAPAGKRWGGVDGGTATASMVGGKEISVGAEPASSMARSSAAMAAAS